MKQSPFTKLVVRSAIQEIPRLLWNPKVHDRIYKNPTLAPVLSKTNSIHTLQPYFPKVK
jgi:hypothetical protein